MSEFAPLTAIADCWWWAGMTRVLVADDDSRFRSAVCLMLQRGGYEVEEAQNGPETLRKVAFGTYDVAVVDYQLPPPDGLEILGRLREIKPHCVRILMSGA